MKKRSTLYISRCVLHVLTQICLKNIERFESYSSQREVDHVYKAERSEMKKFSRYNQTTQKYDNMKELEIRLRDIEETITNDINLRYPGHNVWCLVDAILGCDFWTVKDTFLFPRELQLIYASFPQISRFLRNTYHLIQTDTTCINHQNKIDVVDRYYIYTGNT